MGITAWIALGGFFFNLLVALLVIAINWTKMEEKIKTVEALALSNIDKIKGTLDNTIKDLDRVEGRVTNHKNRVEGKLDLLDSKLDANGIIVNNKIDELKDLIIKEIRK